MRPTIALTVAVACLLALPSSARGAAAAGAVATARDNLQRVRADLSMAIKAIEKDPPSTADLDAAHAAVGALKAAIDAGAAYEADDLEYAKAVLAARKELRVQREYVDQRRAKVHIFEKRRTIEAGVSALNDKLKRLEAKGAGPKDFDDAKAAVAALRKTVDAAKEFTKQDEKFAAFVTETEAGLGRSEKAIDDRATSQLVDKQRDALEDARKTLSGAVGALSKGATDAQFEAGEKAAADLYKHLEEGKSLEDKDKTYKAEADKARLEVAQAKKKMDDLWSETGVERLKAEIEPSHKDLAAAGKAIRAKGVSEDQLAEARTVAIVVRKQLEKFGHQGARSQALRAYLDDVRKTLGEVESELARRGLDGARSAAVAAMRKVEAKGAADADFQAADAALNALEKVLEPLQKPDPAIAAQVADARTLLRDSRASVSKRRVEVSLGGPVSAATKALARVDLKSAVDADFDAADAALTALEKVLAAIGKPEASVAAKVEDAKVLLKTGRANAAKRRVEATLSSAGKAVTAALRPLEKKVPTDEQFAEASTALTVLEKTIEEVKNGSAPAAVADARTLARDAKATVSKRRVEVTLGEPVAAATKALARVDLKSATDADFDAADAALTALEKVLDAIGKPDGAVAAKVADARTLAKVGRTNASKRRVEAGLASAGKAVTQALRLLEKKAPTDEQFAEANTAVTVLEKTIDAVKTKEAAVALADAKTLARDAKATVAKRRVEVTLDGPRTAATKALAKLDGRAPADKDFEDATAALDALDKTVEAVGKPIASVAVLVNDSKVLVKTGRANVAKRRLALDVDRQKAKVEDARKAAAPLLSALPRQGKEQVQQTEDAAKKIVEALDAGVALTKQDKGYAVYDNEVRRRVAEMGDQIARRRTALAASSGAGNLKDLVAAEKAKLSAARQPTAGDAEVEAATKGLEAIKQALEEGKALEDEDRAYLAQADKAREEVGNLRKDLDIVTRARELRRKTVEALEAGAKAFDAAAAAKDMRGQKAQYDKALALFSSCEKGGAIMVEENKVLADVPVIVEGKQATPKDAIAACAQRVKATEAALKGVDGIIGFEDGPKKAFETAKGLLDSGKKAEALAQFSECISSAYIVQRWHPELKDRKFSVGGQSLTVAELIAQCTKQRDALK